MNTVFKSLLLASAFALTSLTAHAEDIDIFVGTSAGTAGNPNVLIVLDNTTNWSSQAQHWPDGSTQGYSEVMSIKDIVDTLTGNINVGLMMYPFNSGGADGGFIRQAVVPMSDANNSAFRNRLDIISNHINGNPNEAASSSRANGTIMFDAYKYFGGYTSPAHSTDNIAGTPTDSTHYGTVPYAASGEVPSSYADTAGYTSSSYTAFASPSTSACSKNFIIYIGNGFPSGTDSTSLLTNVGCDATLLPRPVLSTSSTTTPTTLGTTGQCYSSQAACTSGSPETIACASGYDNCACTTTAAGSASCPSGQLYYTVTHSSTVITTDSTSLACVANTNSYHCPAGSTCVISAPDHGACGSNKDNYIVTLTTTTTSSALSTQCYASSAACNANSAVEGGTCATPTASSNTCSSGTSRYTYVGNVVTTTTTPTGATAIPTSPASKSLADVWAKCLFQTDVNPESGQQNISTYAIDVYNASPDSKQNSLLYNMAKYGGGKYYPATSHAAITAALKEIFAEIQGVNSTFASVSLPVNATNRSQNENQVYIGMFRPDPDAKPRWFGNMKRYQLINTGTAIDLGDTAGLAAINSQTGFVADCATSWWTTDSSNYWENIAITPNPAGSCHSTAYNRYSDAPDGPRVEKGAVAEVLRKGNNSPTTDTSPTWAVNRTMYTLSGSTLVAFNAANAASITANAVSFTRGVDVNNEKDYTALINPLPAELVRPSIHGDVIHSRPLPINYGGAAGVTIYYGANDGALRAVDASTGKERWAFVAPESFASLQRLMDNSPLVSYPSLPAGITPAPTAKNYFFDGSIGVYQNADNSNVWIFPTMRRGGRMIYAFDVSNPLSLAYKWKVGCPNLANDTGCTTGLTGIGQTWSLPNAAFIKGYSTSAPILVVGGGYDSCEDANTSAPSCATPKGAGVYVLNANTGAVVASFGTTRSVPADVALIDIDSDGYVDYAYAADTGGNIYRIDFVDAGRNPLASGSWAIHRVAYTNGSGRKFMFAPALLASSGKVYLAIGSGDREHPLETNYPYASVTNRFYVYLDDLSASSANNLDDTTQFSNLPNPPDCSGNSLLPSSSLKGWFMDLNQYGQGEQTVTSALIAGGMVTFSTNRPIPAASGSCSTSLGEARGYWVNLFNGSGAIGVPGSCGGTRSATFVGGGLPPSPVIGSVPIAGRQTTVIIGAAQRTGGASSPISPQQVTPTISSKRKIIYWKSSGDN